MSPAAATPRMAQKLLSEWCLSLSLEAYYEHAHTDILWPVSVTVFCRLAAVLINEISTDLRKTSCLTSSVPQNAAFKLFFSTGKLIFF